MYKLKLITSLVILACLTGCGGSGEADNTTDNSSNVDDGLVIDKRNIYAGDQSTSIVAGERSLINLSNHIYTSDGTAAALDSVTAISPEPQCNQVEQGNLSFTIQADTTGTCIYEYTVIDASRAHSAIGMSRVIIQPTTTLLQTNSEKISVTAELNSDTLISLTPPTPLAELSGDITVLGSGLATIDTTANTVTYTAGSEEFDTGVTRILYSFIDSVDGTIYPGTIDISVSIDTLNHAPPAYDFRYADRTAEPEDQTASKYPYIEVLTSDVVTIDIADYLMPGFKDNNGTVIPSCNVGDGETPAPNCISVNVESGSNIKYLTDVDGDPLQLVDFNTFNATLSPDTATDSILSNGELVSTKFTFSSGIPRHYAVTYTLSDHLGGFSSGVIDIKVVSQLKDVYVSADDITFLAPISYTEAKDVNLEVNTMDTSNGTTGPDGFEIPVFGWEIANNYCSAVGGRLPSISELENLYAQEGNIFSDSSAKWPITRPYWSSNRAIDGSKISVFDLSNNNQDSYLPLEENGGAYVSCVAEPNAVQLRIYESGELLANQTYQLTAEYLSYNQWLTYPNINELTWSNSDERIMTVNDTGLLTTNTLRGNADISVALIGQPETSVSSNFFINPTISSILYGDIRSNSSTNTFVIGQSNNMQFQCGAIVDGIGTPELGIVGGGGGSAKTFSARNIEKIEVTYGDYQYDPSGTVINRLKFFYKDNTSKQCGIASLSTNIKTSTFNMPTGYHLSGFIAYGDNYLHALQFATDLD